MNINPKLLKNVNEQLNTKQDKLTTLWTNPNPTSSFEQQTITLSSSDYDILIWICILWSGDGATGRKYTTGTFKGNNISLNVGGNYGGNMCVFEREATRTSDTKYNVGNGNVRKANGSATDNAFAIPFKVIGIKL